MTVTRLTSAALVLVAVATLGCGESPTGPVAPPQTSLLGWLLGPTGLLSCSPLPTATTTKTVGWAGGALKVGPHTLVIPPGALSAPVTITATAPSGSVNRVQFKPEGLTFQRSAALTMSYANCNLLGQLLPKHIAYTDNALNILSYLLSLDNLFTKQVTGQLKHFSNYAIAW